jgi:hypothetical protein
MKEFGKRDERSVGISPVSSALFIAPASWPLRQTPHPRTRLPGKAKNVNSGYLTLAKFNHAKIGKSRYRMPPAFYQYLIPAF